MAGQYLAGNNGILVENGKRIRPIAGVTIAASADEITCYDNVNSPTLMVKRMRGGA